MRKFVVAAAAALSFTAPASAAEIDLIEGTHYQLLTPAQPTSSSPEVIEVVEFFWYGCPHCYAFEPNVQAWRDELPEDVVFIQIPGTFNALYKLHAKAFYTARALGILDELHDDFFDEIHVEGNIMRSEEALMEFFGRYGVSEDDFRSTFNSFAVSTEVARAESLARRYRLRHVPTVIVNGKYVTDGNMSGTWSGLIQIMDELVERERDGS